MRLKSLSLERFRSFVDKTKIEFPKTGLTLVSGINYDTGDSSGAGKSSVLLGIAYVLGFSPFAASDCQSWQADKLPLVSLELDTLEGIMIISRGTKFSISINGESVKGSAKQLEEKIDSVFGLNVEMRKLLTYRGQKSPGLVLSKTDAELKEFLMKLLGLHQFEAATLESAAAITSIEVNLRNSQSIIDSLNEQLTSIADRPSLELASKVVTETERAIENQELVKKELEAQVAALANEQEAMLTQGAVPFDRQEVEASEALRLIGPVPAVDLDETELNKLLANQESCRARFTTLQIEDTTKRKDIDTKRASLNKQIQDKVRSAGSLDSLNREKSKIELELAKLKVGECPTCEQPWGSVEELRAKLNSSLATVNQKLEAYNRSMLEVNALNDELAQVPQFTPNPTIEKLQTAHSKIGGQIAAERQRLESEQTLATSGHRAKLAEAMSVINKIKLAKQKAIYDLGCVYSNKVAPIRGRINDLIRQDKALWAELSYAKEQVARCGEIEKSWNDLNSRLDAANKKHAELTTQHNVEKDFSELIGRTGFLGSIFDECLEEISMEANNILATVANTRHVSFEFVSETLTQKGNIQRKITPMITIGGHQAPFKSGLSGGMQSSVELAVDLAAAIVGGRRSGIVPGWMILDEAFEGLGTVSKESCFEMLATAAHDRLILVVDHASEMKSLFTNTINVEYRDGKSAIV